MSSLIIQRVGLRFHAHLLKTSSRQPNKLRKHLEAEKIDVRINPKSENRKQKRFSGVGLFEHLGSDKHTQEAGLTDALYCLSDYEW